MKRWIAASAVALIIAVASSTALPSLEGASPPQGDLTFEIFKDARNEFRWRLRARNGKIIGMADEGYTRKDACRHAIGLIQEGAAKAKVEDISAND